jgi:TonB family protein
MRRRLCLTRDLPPGSVPAETPVQLRHFYCSLADVAGKVENDSSSGASRTSKYQMSEQRQIDSPNARFLAGNLSTNHVEVKRAGNATLVSLVLHVGFVLLGLLAIARPPQAFSPNSDDLPNEIVWLDTTGPGGGGGGGGNNTPEPPRKAELKGEDKITVPVPKLEKPTPEIAKEMPKPPAQLQIPAQPTATGVLELPGMVSNLPTPGASQGPGSGGGAGTGSGGGIGPGTGSGLGPGSGGGMGGGEFRPGNGVTSPEILFEKRPEYTSEAMRAKVQGVVEVEALVNPDGTVGRVQIIRSLDDRFGLDQKAVEAVRMWRFRPGMRQGRAVPVLVTIELTFTLR